LRSPNSACRPDDFAIIESARSNENEVGPGLGLAEHLGSTPWTKAPVHRVAAVGDAGEIAQLAFDADRRTRETHIHRAVA
jgi:hypothetical protein